MERAEDKYRQIVEILFNSQEVRRWAKLESCRLWTGVALDVIEQIFPNMEAEAREVDIDHFLQHTFIRITGGRPYILDGVGTLDHEPFFGFEDEAPEHLRNSRPDKMINNYRKLKV